ncbi:MAG: hypothetical protein WBQ18_01095 [Solirubrobacteraceae bacterium]
MPSPFVLRTLAGASQRIPGVRRIPVVRLLAASEVALLARDHLRRLTPEERRRLATLVRVGRGRRSRLTEDERQEMQQLLVKLEARRLTGEAFHRLSPVPLPRRLLFGPSSGRR